MKVRPERPPAVVRLAGWRGLLAGAIAMSALILRDGFAEGNLPLQASGAVNPPRRVKAGVAVSGPTKRLA
jgi:hypothetical protein